MFNLRSVWIRCHKVITWLIRFGLNVEYADRFWITQFIMIRWMLISEHLINENYIFKGATCINWRNDIFHQYYSTFPFDESAKIFRICSHWKLNWNKLFIHWKNLNWKFSYLQWSQSNFLSFICFYTFRMLFFLNSISSYSKIYSPSRIFLSPKLNTKNGRSVSHRKHELIST